MVAPSATYPAALQQLQLRSCSHHGDPMRRQHRPPQHLQQTKQAPPPCADGSAPQQAEPLRFLEVEGNGLEVGPGRFHQPITVAPPTNEIKSGRLQMMSAVMSEHAGDDVMAFWSDSGSGSSTSTS